jgi:endonuclease YncB( thermonuclease family)
MHLLHRFGKEAPLGAFFVAAIWLLAVPAHALCNLDSQQKNIEAVQVHKVLDGDTVTLTDGRRIRLIGINTPELEHPPRPEEPLAQDAKIRLEALVRKSPVFLQQGSQPKDHYGRTLGHLFTADGSNIIVQLLQAGAGFQVAIPPNLAHADCYAEAQAHARSSQAGVWGHAYFDPLDAAGGKLRNGYQRVRGQVERVSLTRKVVWIDLAGDLTLKLDRKHAAHLAGDTFDQVVTAAQQRSGPAGLQLEVRGWVVDRSKWGKRATEQIASGKRKRFQLNLPHASQWNLVSASPNLY